jgi:hypothetical protein
MRLHRLTVPSTLAMLLVAPLLLVACGTGRLSFHKPGVTVAQRQLDEKECGLASADDPDHGPLLVYRVDRDAVANCMAALGYTVMRGSRVASR